MCMFKVLADVFWLQHPLKCLQYKKSWQEQEHFLQACDLDEDEDEDEAVQVREIRSGLQKAKQLFDNLGYTFERNLNERHPDTPSVRSAGVFYRFEFLLIFDSMQADQREVHFPRLTCSINRPR